jgi:sterol desaturase/sphingolipid hydroxylase (fatty acid hydroxylase superfamily)
MLIQFVVGLVYANLTEWLVHKYILHGLGKRKGTFWSFHWHEHHHNSRKSKFYDVSYMQPFYSGSRFREILGTVCLMLTHIWLVVWFPWFILTTWCYAGVYLWAHRKSHLEPEWCKRWLPWHYDHHLARNQDANWGVLLPFWDWVLGTREKM